MGSLKNQDHIDEWKREDVANLSKHFHEYCTSTHQHKRVHYFEMLPSNVNIFTALRAIKSIDIHMAIKSGNSFVGKFRFYPIIEIDTVEQAAISRLPFEPRKRFEGVGIQSDFVPEIFKDMILDNWSKIDTGDIDDLFIAQERDAENKPTDQMVRVHNFQLNEKMIDFINDLNFIIPATDGVEARPNITAITLYPGVDMNKFGKKEFISFTPVLGIKHQQDAPNILNSQGGVETIEKETFMEYMFPCPPTCVRKPRGGK